MGELEKFVEEALYETCSNDYGFVDPCLENIKLVFVEVRNEFPLVPLEEDGKSIDQRILYWEHYIEILKMSRDDKDTAQIPWIKNYVRQLKWVERWFW